MVGTLFIIDNSADTKHCLYHTDDVKSLEDIQKRRILLYLLHLQFNILIGERRCLSISSSEAGVVLKYTPLNIKRKET